MPLFLTTVFASFCYPHIYMRGFTARQLEITQFIKATLEASGKAPSLRDIMRRFSFRSTGCVRGHLLRLEKKSAIRRELYTHRGIKVLGANIGPIQA